MPQTPWHSLPSRTSALLHPNLGRRGPTQHGGDPGVRALGQGHPQTGHPGHLPGCACAPAARLRPLTSRLRGAVPGKADYAPALRLCFSPASPPASLLVPGTARGHRAEPGAHPDGRNKP